MQRQMNRWLWSGVAVAGIWLMTTAASVWSPNLITGAQHERIPLIAINAPIWAMLASGLVLMAPAVSASDGARVWIPYAGAVTAAWIAAALISIAAPSLVTGTDPTTIPLAGIVAPIAAMAATAYATVGVVALAARDAIQADGIDGVIRRWTEIAAPSG